MNTLYRLEVEASLDYDPLTVSDDPADVLHRWLTRYAATKTRRFRVTEYVLSSIANLIGGTKSAAFDLLLILQAAGKIRRVGEVPAYMDADFFAEEAERAQVRP